MNSMIKCYPCYAINLGIIHHKIWKFINRVNIYAHIYTLYNQIYPIVQKQEEFSIIHILYATYRYNATSLTSSVYL